MEYVDRPDGSARCRCVKLLTDDELTQRARTIGLDVGPFLEWQGLLER
jgi:post-segregation antitoxin (ccd killing protein)